MSQSLTMAKLESLHDKLTMLEAQIHLGVTASEVTSHRTLITTLENIEFMNRNNY